MAWREKTDRRDKGRELKEGKEMKTECFKFQKS